MARIRNNSWQDDLQLKEALQHYIKSGLNRTEILDFMQRDFSQYAWSPRTLDRRLQHFEIRCINRNISVDQVRDAVQEELQGPGNLLGYRAMHQKLRQLHDLAVPRDLVHDVMFELDPEGLECRAPGFKTKKKGNFTSPGPNFVHSLDGHNKLMGFQNSTYPIAVYGCLDTCSQKVLWVKVWRSNSDPKLIGRFYLEYLYEQRTIASMLRVDKGTETGVMATMHAYLRQQHGDMDAGETVLFGPSTSNQIERWWKELHERLEKYYKQPLLWLKDQGHYDPQSETHRCLLAYIMIPLIQKEINSFVLLRNSHRIRKQSDTVLPDGIPNHIYNFPENYDLRECGWKVSDEQLREVAELSGVLQVHDDYLDSVFRAQCERLLPDPSNLEPADCGTAFLFLCEHI